MKTNVSTEMSGERRYDYDKQAWVVDGVYEACAHPENMSCKCYGREHEGEQAEITESCH